MTVLVLQTTPSNHCVHNSLPHFIRGFACTVCMLCRKDFFYPYDQYREANLPDPVHGGRFHLVSIASASGSPGQITLNGKEVKFESGQNPDDWYVDWLLVYPTKLVQGQPVWVSFHTRLAAGCMLSCLC